MSIKYYHLAKDEEPPEEFCAVRDVNGEPSEYTWYERMSEFERELWVQFNKSDWFAGSEYRKLQADNAKLRELLKAAYRCTNAGPSCLECRMVAGGCTLLSAMRELGVEVSDA